MTEGTRDILRRVEHWPQKDQDELADVAREIEARRTGVYVLSDDEERRSMRRDAARWRQTKK